MAATGAGRAGSQHRSEWSSLPIANQLPPGGTAVQVALPVWPVNVHIFFPSVMSHRAGCARSYTARHSVPEGEIERATTGLLLPGRVSKPVSPPGRVTETVPSACPQAMAGPEGEGARQVTGDA